MEDKIVVKDGLSAMQKRHLIEITNVMVNGINEKEFTDICKIYGVASERLLREVRKD